MNAPRFNRISMERFNSIAMEWRVIGCLVLYGLIIAGLALVSKRFF